MLLPLEFYLEKSRENIERVEKRRNCNYNGQLDPQVPNRSGTQANCQGSDDDRLLPYLALLVVSLRSLGKRKDSDKNTNTFLQSQMKLSDTVTEVLQEKTALRCLYFLESQRFPIFVREPSR